MQVEKPTVLQAARNASWVTLERLAGLVIQLGVGVIVVRGLGPPAYGRYSFALGVVGIFSLLATLGNNQLFVREFVRSPNPEVVFRQALMMRGSAALTMTALALVLGGFVGAPEFPYGDLLIAATTIVAAPLVVPALWYQARLKEKRASAVRLGAIVGSGVLQIAAVTWTESVAAVLAATAIQPWLAGLALLAFYRIDHRIDRHPTSGSVSRDVPRMRRLWSETVPLIGSVIGLSMLLRVDQWMLGLLGGAEEVGYYSAAAKVSEIIAFLPLAIANSFVALYAADALSSRRYARVAYAFTWACVLATVPFFVTLSNLIVTYLFGTEFLPAAVLLRIHAASAVPFALAQVRDRHLISVGQTFLVGGLSLGAALTNVVLNAALIPDYGAEGAAWSTIVAYGAMFMVFPLAWRVGRVHLGLAISALRDIPALAGATVRHLRRG